MRCSASLPLIAFLLGLLTVCAPSRQAAPGVDLRLLPTPRVRHLSDRERAGSADLVVAGTVVERKTEPVQPDLEIEGVPLVLWTITLEVDAVLFGPPNISRRIEYRFFNFDPALGMNGSFERVGVGERIVAFLRRVGDSYWNGTDLFENSLHISYPDRNKRVRTDPDRYKSLASYLLATPATTNEERNLAAEMLRNAGYAISFAGYQWAFQRLDQIGARAEGTLRESIDEAKAYLLYLPVHVPSSGNAIRANTWSPRLLRLDSMKKHARHCSRADGSLADGVMATETTEGRLDFLNYLASRHPDRAIRVCAQRELSHIQQ